MDLGLEPNQSDYGQELAQKQARFQREFERMQTKIFEDSTNSTLVMPGAAQYVEEAWLEETDDLGGLFEGLGKDINAISEIMHSRYRAAIGADTAVEKYA